MLPVEERMARMHELGDAIVKGFRAGDLPCDR